MMEFYTELEAEHEISSEGIHKPDLDDYLKHSFGAGNFSYVGLDVSGIYIIFLSHPLTVTQMKDIDSLRHLRDVK